MAKNTTGKNDIWRYIAGCISILYIIYMWSEKDIANIYATMPEEQILPMVVTTVLVSALKVAAWVGVILLLKWLYKKFKK